MQNLSFTTFLEQYLPDLQKDPNFAEYVKIALFLVKKYNKNIFLSSYEKAIKKDNEKLRDFIDFLGKYGFWSKKHLETLAKEIQKQDKSLQFKLYVPTTQEHHTVDKVNTILKKDFKEYKLEHNDYSHLGIVVKGNGYQYKRNLDSDLDILLK